MGKVSYQHLLGFNSQIKWCLCIFHKISISCFFLKKSNFTYFNLPILIILKVITSTYIFRINILCDINTEWKRRLKWDQMGVSTSQSDSLILRKTWVLIGSRDWWRQSHWGRVGMNIRTTDRTAYLSVPQEQERTRQTKNKRKMNRKEITTK